jgi:hypothetical protein
MDFKESAPMTCLVSSQHLARRIARLPETIVWCVTIAGLLSLPGCLASSDLPELGNVKGVVTLDGKPLPHAQIQFVPTSGRPSNAESDEDGSYRLQYTTDVRGAVIGAHTVQIRTAVEGRDDPSKERLPARYHAKSKLKAEVKPGSNQINFELSSK